MTRKLYVLNGPNLDMLGVREPAIYGTTTLADIERDCARVADELAFELRFAQSNAEHEIIDWLHDAYRDSAAVVINPAGLSFRSVPGARCAPHADRADRRAPHHEHPWQRRSAPPLIDVARRDDRDRQAQGHTATNSRSDPPTIPFDETPLAAHRQAHKSQPHTAQRRAHQEES